jgi:hypothetical protein
VNQITPVENKRLPVPPRKQVVNLFSFINVIEYVKYTVVKFFRISYRVISGENGGGR